MNAMPPLEPDAQQISSFVSAMFRYAEEGTYASLRSFREHGHETVFINSAPFHGDLAALAESATRSARRAARNADPAVFAPPIATFRSESGWKATEADLANGLALSVECDKTPTEARAKLEQMLGPATVIVASGGEWPDADGVVHDKLHLHWRLTEPTRTVEEHAELKRARKLAQVLVGGDHSNVPTVHPIRWPGSWHRKKMPRLARIVSIKDSAELELGETLEVLLDALKAAGIDEASLNKPGRSGGAGAEAGQGTGESRETGELIRAIVTGEDYHSPIAVLAMRYLKGGMPDPQVVITLRGFMEAVPEAIRDLKDGVVQSMRWQARYDDIPRAVSTARDKVGDRPAAGEASDPGSPGAEWPEPFNFMIETAGSGAGRLHADHIPDALRGFVFDTAQRMGTDPAALALFAVVACASVVTDDWRVQVRVHDYTWTEQPRLWATMVAGPSFKKSPTLKNATAPVDRLEMEARRQHQQDHQRWERDCEEAKAQNVPKSQWPREPRLPRYLVENTTIEALSEVLRDDAKATQTAPARKILVRQDEMAGFIGDMDRYAAGGKGGGDRGHYLQLYNGGSHNIDRINRGAMSIPSWSGCLVGGIQPEPIQRIAKDADDDGLLQRFLFCVPTKVEDGDDRVPDAVALGRYHALFPALAALRPAEGMDGRRQVVVFHAGAHKHRESVGELLKIHGALPDNSVRMRASLDKWHGTFARLALTFHLIEIADKRARGQDAGPLNIVSEATAERVARYMEDVLLPHLYRAEALLYNTPQTGHARWIAGFILTDEEVRKAGRVSMRDLTRAYHVLRAPERHAELRTVMLGLEGMGWVKAETTRAGREVHAWEINPKLAGIFAEWAAAERARRDQVREQVQKMSESRRRAKQA